VAGFDAGFLGTAAGSSAITRPAALPTAGNSGAGSPWTPEPASRKPDSEIATAVAKAAGTVGERWASAGFIIE
jgi:hypothetical protein